MIRKIVVVIALFVSIAGFSQKSNTSAYSFFGIGDKNSLSTVEQLSMGGVGVAMGEVHRLNLSNPASYSSLLFTNYSIALDNKNIRAKNSNDNQSASATYLSYVAMGIPVGDKGGFSFGLLPNTSVGYSLLSNIYDDEDTVIEATRYEGEGGTNKAFFGFGYSPFKKLSLGLQGNYVFGKIENNIINQEKDVSLATKYETISNIKGFSFNVGFIYKTTINKLNLHVGGNFDLENDIDSEGNEYLYSISLGAVESPRDTILNKQSSGILRSPLKTTLGVGLGKDNVWYAGADFSFQKALEFQGDVVNNNSKVAYDSYSRIAIGGFYTPKVNSLTGYWKRVTYRAGMKLEKTGLLVDASGSGNDFTEINDFGISFGVGLPVKNQLSNVNLGFEIGKRGKSEKGLVLENYANFRLSLSFSDKWFKKRKIY